MSTTTTRKPKIIKQDDVARFESMTLADLESELGGMKSGYDRVEHRILFYARNQAVMRYRIGALLVAAKKQVDHLGQTGAWPRWVAKQNLTTNWEYVSRKLFESTATEEDLHGLTLTQALQMVGVLPTEKEKKRKTQEKRQEPRGEPGAQEKTQDIGGTEEPRDEDLDLPDEEPGAQDTALAVNLDRKLLAEIVGRLRLITSVTKEDLPLIEEGFAIFARLRADAV